MTSGLTSQYVSNYQEPVDPACANLCAASQVAPGRSLLLFPIGLLYGCAFMKRERTRMFPRVGDGSPWQKMRHWTLTMCIRRWTGPSIASETRFDKERLFPIPRTSSMTKWMFGTSCGSDTIRCQHHFLMVLPWTLVVPSCHDIRGLLYHKSMRKATGIDDLPLRLVSRLSDDCLTALGEFIGCIERLRLWLPLLHVLVRVPKPTGGHRLIALLHDLAELWGVIRRPPAAEWECLYELPEFWGGASKSSTRGVFQRRLDSEVARELGGTSISIMVDQEKCYEMVPFSCLCQEALSSDFSPTLCWMVLQSYGQPRVI